MSQQAPPPPPKSFQSKDSTKATVSALVLLSRFGEIGFTIAIPLAILVFIGVKVDRYFGTTPLFILIGVALSMVFTVWGIARLIKQLEQ